MSAPDHDEADSASEHHEPEHHDEPEHHEPEADEHAGRGLPPPAHTSMSLARASRMAQSLNDAARRARFATRGRSTIYAGGFRARRGEQAFMLAVVLSFLALVMLPTVVAAVYYGALASDQYVSEMRFTLRGGSMPTPDSIGALTGIPALQTAQDTQVISNYMQSQSLVEELVHKTDFVAWYSRPEIDWYARLNPESPIEKIARYWKTMTEVSIEMPGAIVTFSVKAFRATDAAALANAVLAMSENMVNVINDRLRRDALYFAKSDFQKASDTLTAARSNLEKARNEEGLLDANRTADAVSDLIKRIQSIRIGLKQQYESQKSFLSDDAPQMRNIKAQIEAADTQIADLNARLTSSKTGSKGKAISASISRLATLDLEYHIAEKAYATASATLEQARILGETKLIYLNPFVLPKVPGEARYPQRLSNILTSFFIALMIWGSFCGVVVLVRNNMA